jgi:hypothetical protein
MNANCLTRTGSDTALDTLAAELTDAAFPVALHHGAGTDWLDAKLELWHVLEHAVKNLTPMLREAQSLL